MNKNEKSKETYAVVRAMEDALIAGSNDMGKYFHEKFRWMGSQGCGTKNSLEEFRNNWQLPLRAAFRPKIQYRQVLGRRRVGRMFWSY